VIAVVCGRQFKAAIANVWILRNEKLTEVSLFSTQVIPDFMWRRKISHDDDLSEESDADPLLYIGKLGLFFDYDFSIISIVGLREMCEMWPIVINNPGVCQVGNCSVSVHVMAPRCSHCYITVATCYDYNPLGNLNSGRRP